MSRRYRPFDPFERGGPFDPSREFRMPQVPRRFWGGVALFALAVLVFIADGHHRSGPGPGHLLLSTHASVPPRGGQLVSWTRLHGDPVDRRPLLVARRQL